MYVADEKFGGMRGPSDSTASKADFQELRLRDLVKVCERSGLRVGARRLTENTAQRSFPVRSDTSTNPGLTPRELEALHWVRRHASTQHHPLLNQTSSSNLNP